MTPSRPQTPKAPTPAAKPPAPAANRSAGGAVEFGTIPRGVGQRIVLFGPGGIGKTSLALLAPGPIAFVDLDESLPMLAGDIESLGLDVRPLAGVQDWDSIRAALAAPGWDSIRTIVIDTATRAEELATDWVIANVKHEKGNKIERIEDYGFGKGYTHLYETFLKLLGDLDRHVRGGRNVVLIAHDCTTAVPNPTGEDWLRYEPRLQSPGSGKNSIRLRVREWADHLLFIGYDVDVSDGKGKGSGTRTIYPNELPHCMAKSRSLAAPFAYTIHNPAIWEAMIAG